MLRESVIRFIRSEYKFEARRKLLAGEVSFSARHWTQYAELGWLAMPFAESEGGLGGRLLDVAIVMEGFGRGLVFDPYLPTIMAGRLVARLGTPGQKQKYLIPAIEGRKRLALAFVELQSRYDIRDCITSAVLNKGSGGFTIRGRKPVVIGGDAADAFVVVARTGGDRVDESGLSLFIVDRPEQGLQVKPYRLNDGLGAAELILDEVVVKSEALLGDIGDSFLQLEDTIDFGTVCVAAEAVGAMEAACDATLDHLKTRKQFGKPLGTNQALQHRMVDMAIALEEARSSALVGTSAGEAGDNVARRRGVSLAKIEINRTGIKIGQEAVQLHGAMGVTEELAIGHYFKRLTAIAATFGDASWHVHRICEAPNTTTSPREGRD